ncbi:hypothetical protein [Caldovatus aquaticus]|uniref:Uncharacterized protein n=1 Tax=Caldovatus aquaticus TaxID=2865671 RepID=A0ABS7F0C6_9PROT|nr:hypothetical protein [Caldovatus aquaticus]MBW8268783.1 hypothetical protein [Caldovatus aquaticus]
MAFNSLATLAIVALEAVAGKMGAQLGVWIALLLALGLLLVTLAPGGRRQPLAALGRQGA